MGGEVEELSLNADGRLCFRCEWPFDWPTRYDILLPKGVHPTRLPKCVSAEGRLLHIYLAGRGTWAVDIQTAPD